MLGRCSHEFSWPRRAADGDYYQVCLLCAAEYKYDWKTMRRIKRVNSAPEAASEPLRNRSRKKPTCRPQCAIVPRGWEPGMKAQWKTSANRAFYLWVPSNCPRIPWWKWSSRCPRRFPGRRTAWFCARVESFAERKGGIRNRWVWPQQFSTTSSCDSTELVSESAAPTVCQEIQVFYYQPITSTSPANLQDAILPETR
jgi:hypothetical protein